MPDTGAPVLPSYATPPILIAALWTAIAAVALTDATAVEKAVLGPVPAAVVSVFAVWDYVLWRRRGRPWHDWHIILLLLPPIAAGVWVAAGALILDAPYTREELLGVSVGPGIALVGLLVTVISYHGRHHPDEDRRRA